jgi:hypothetical protein
VECDQSRWCFFNHDIDLVVYYQMFISKTVVCLIRCWACKYKFSIDGNHF